MPDGIETIECVCFGRIAQIYQETPEGPRAGTRGDECLCKLTHDDGSVKEVSPRAITVKPSEEAWLIEGEI